MKSICEFVDERQKSWCIQCGGWICNVETNRDHVPSKGFLRKPYPENLPVVETCVDCNNGFSADEEYLFVFLSCVLAGSTDPEHQKDANAARALSRHKKLRARIEKSKNNYQTIGGDTRYIWEPEKDRVERVVLKNARGHAYYEYGEPMLTEPEHVCAWPLEALTPAEREEFESIHYTGTWPEVGSRMMTRLITGKDLCNGWVIVQDGTYRYSVEQHGLMMVRSVMSEYLATEVYWSS